MQIKPLLSRRAAGLVLLAALAFQPATAQEPTITVASTTSTEDSGLFKHILPLFTAKTGITVKVVAQGTGQALDTGRRGDADVVLVHARVLEEKFVADGFGVKRYDVMYNDFVLAGPATDPAGIRAGMDIVAALNAIHMKSAPFVSRGDRSGTHAAELELWRLTGQAPGTAKPSWYREFGQGMGAALNAAQSLGAYTLSDRATWLSFRNRQGMEIAIEGDPLLFNPYGVMLVNPRKHPHVKARGGQAFIDWLISAEGQLAIESFTINGEKLFFGSAKPKPLG